MRVVVDASAYAAMVFGEPQGALVSQQIDRAEVFAPALLKFELTNVAWKKARRRPADAAQIASALAVGRSSIVWRDVDLADVFLMAHAAGLTAYDASYLWLAGSLGANLVTLDARLSQASAAL